MAALIKAGEGVIKTSMWTSLIMGIALIIGGAVLVYLGATGDTELSLFGNSFKSQNVGAVGIFCGAVLVILGNRRSLRSMERLGLSHHEGPPKGDHDHLAR
jgi:hypothetical protein